MDQRILVVDDEESIRFTFREFLRDEGFQVETASSLDECRSALQGGEFDLVFMDILLGKDSGIDALRVCKELSPNSPVVMITGSPEIETAAEAVRFGAFDYIPKPIRHETLLRLARSALQHKELIDQKEAYRSRLRAIFQSVKEGIITVNRDMVVTDINEAGKVIFGSEEPMEGKPLQAILPKDHACIDLVQNSMNTTQPTDVFRVEMALGSKDPQILSLTTAPLVDEHGVSLGAVLTIRDETRLDFLERDLTERQTFDRMIGSSRKMQDNYQLIESLADVDTTVLITGESGTGKELVAESLHYRGDRRQKPLVKVNCAALPENLLESELFGHVKGSFTGAMHDKTGRFQKADGGTIFLDEIADISPALQVRLLRVLQEREIEKVGGSEPIKVDIRVITATNKNLLEMVRAGEFREDLYYRLKVVELKVPPLRERLEDIPLLVDHFIDKFNSKFRRQVSGVSDEVMQIFMRHDWPGNIRELEHLIEHTFILCRGNLVTIADLPDEFRDNSESPGMPAANGADSPEDILDALRRAGGNKSRAADLLGVSRRTIYRKIEEFGIDEKEI